MLIHVFQSVETAEDIKLQDSAYASIRKLENGETKVEFEKEPTASVATEKGEGNSVAQIPEAKLKLEEGFDGHIYGNVTSGINVNHPVKVENFQRHVEDMQQEHQFQTQFQVR